MNKDLVEVVYERQFHYAEDQLKAYSVFARKLYQQNIFTIEPHLSVICKAEML
jgi:hypothetical protein